MDRPILMALVVAGGGAIGALARHLTTVVVAGQGGLPRWTATLLVNLVGCLAIGVAWRLLEHHRVEDWVRGLCLTGILGALTTYSTFALDLVQLKDRPWVAVGYAAASLVGGVALVMLGHALAAVVTR